MNFIFNVFQNLRIRTKLLIASIGMIVVIALISLINYYKVDQLNILFDLSVNNHYVKTIATNNLLDSVNTISRNVRNVLIVKNDAKELNDATKRIQNSFMAFENNLKLIEKMIIYEKEQLQYNQLLQMKNNYVEVHKEVIRLFNQSDFDSATESVMYGKSRNTQRLFFEEIFKFLDLQTQYMQEKKQEAIKHENEQIWFSLSMIFISIILATIMVLVLNKTISKPIEDATFALRELAKGNLHLFDKK